MADWLKDIGDKFSQIGAGVRSGADELRKVAGIGVGSMSLTLDRYDFTPGDKVTGKITLALEEPLDGKRLVVGMVGSRKRIGYEKGTDGRTTQSSHTEKVYEFERQLDGEHSYQTGEYDFELVVPDDASPQSGIDADGLVGDVARLVAALSQSGRTSIKWQVYAFLDLPWKRNVKAKSAITVNAAG